MAENLRTAPYCFRDKSSGKLLVHVAVNMNQRLSLSRAALSAKVLSCYSLSHVAFLITLSGR